MATERGVLLSPRGSFVSERGNDGIEGLIEVRCPVRGRGPVDEPAGDWLNDLPQGVICSRRRLVWVCFHARRGYGKTGKATLPFKTLGVGRPPRLRTRLFTPCLWDGSGRFQ